MKRIFTTKTNMKFFCLSVLLPAFMHILQGEEPRALPLAERIEQCICAGDSLEVVKQKLEALGFSTTIQDSSADFEFLNGIGQLPEEKDKLEEVEVYAIDLQAKIGARFYFNIHRRLCRYSVDLNLRAGDKGKTLRSIRQLLEERHKERLETGRGGEPKPGNE